VAPAVPAVAVPHAGELLGLLTALLWAFAATFFGIAGRRSHPTLVNVLRLPSALLLLGGAYAALHGTPWPGGLPGRVHLWLGLSGLVGLVVGDTFLFHAIALVGPRRAMLMLAATPAFAAVAAWLLMGETISPVGIAGMAVVAVGIVVATLGRDEGGGDFHRLPPAVLRRGLAAALVCALCSGVGNAFAKQGMNLAAGLDPLGATLVRMGWANLGIVLLLAGRGDVLRELPRLRSAAVAGPTALGVLLGPFLGMWAAISAIKLTETGVATVLMNSVPVTVLLPAWLFHRDPPSRAALAGIVLVLAGGVVLVLR